MDELSKNKKTRGALKSIVTKYINKIDVAALENSDIKDLHEHFNYLTEMSKQIKEADKEIQNSIKVEADFMKEVETAIEYSEKLTVMISKISAQLKIRQSNTLQIDPNTLATFNRQNEFESSTTGNVLINKNVNVSKSIKLPKLSINKYYGDPCEWLEFINQFENSIDKNTDLTNIDKFAYLKSLLGGVAFNVVNGFSLTDENYQNALKLLKERFGREELVINAHMSKLLNLYPIKNSNNIVGLRKLYDTIEVQIRSLDSLNVTSKNYGHILIPILTKILPEDLVLDFNRKCLSKSEETEFDVSELLKFLKIEIQCRESFFLQNREDRNRILSADRKLKSKALDKNNTFVKSDFDRHKQRNNPATQFMATSADAENRCFFCLKNHSPEFCVDVSIPEKKEIIKKQARCFSCLARFHKIKNCLKKETCDLCHSNSKHNRTLCYQLENKSNPKAEIKENKVISAISQCSDNFNEGEKRSTSNNIFLQTCSVAVKQSDKYTHLRLLLDSGSMRSFVTLETSQKLKLPIVRKENLSVYAFGAKQAVQKEYNVVKIKLENRNEPTLNVEVEALVTDEISASKLPSPDTNIRKTYTKLKGLQLADNYDCKNNKIEMLIGVDYYHDIVLGRLMKLNNKLVASETIFGWCLIGKSDNTNELVSMKVFVEEKNISEQLKEFWHLENLGVESETEVMDKVETQILESFNSTTKYENNRYIVKLPWKQEMKQKLNDNKLIAKQRFFKLYNRLQNNISLYSDYNLILNDYLNCNIIESLDENIDTNTDGPVYYLPHRGVIRDDKVTSKLRIVFDASSHAPGEISLNDCLESGPNLNPDVFQLLIRFRRFPIAFIADIKQAFLQIEISDEDRDVTRFFWSDNDTNNLRTFRFTRVLFGVNSSPFLLAATIKLHLKKYEQTNPAAYKLLDECLYVDDVIGGDDNVEEAFRVSLECKNIFGEAGMVLRKFQTNSPELRDLWKESGLLAEESNEGNLENDSLKVLGTSWDTKTDSFYFDSRQLENFVERRTNTKRFLLQVAGRVFDPIGILGPFVVRIKCLIQEIWCSGIDWDEPLPKELNKTWNQWCDEIKYLREIRIPRYHLAGAFPNEVDSLQLHCFSDASKKAYGSIVYLRATLKDGRILSNFLVSKSRVSPLKTLSIPRLELMSALLSVRLCDRIVQAIQFQIPVTRHFWTDSSITYFWIKSEPERLKVFVRNRVREIQKNSSPCEWSHCPGCDNPADCISRGLTVNELKTSDFWWHGPQWLRQDESYWPKSLEPPNPSDVELENFEFRKNVDVNTIVTEDKVENELVSRYSSFTELVRICAWVLRFSENCKLKASDRNKNPHLSSSELQKATRTLIKNIQHTEFPQEIKHLIRNQPLPKNSKLLSLNVFLDEEGLLRVGGRIRLSDLPNSQKHQLLLPKAHPFTDLLIEHYHKRLFHSGTQTTLSTIRQLYWIPSGQARVRRIINKCMICFRTKAQTLNQIMGDLPKNRIIPSRPFQTTGIDFAGPIITKPNLKRSKAKIKSYVAIFICFSTKATHLEIVSDLTTEAFVASLKRFIARRSRPSTIWSDNASNFKGADSVINTLFEIIKRDPVQHFTANEGIQWKFIPPASPHFGGLWEANIKSMKRLLLKVTKSSVLTFEELNTLIVQIEAILNSRPLCPLSSDPTDLQPLTPGHFLVGAPLVSLPENDTALDSLSPSSRWTLIQRARKQFWSRWTTEYLTSLQTRGKWTQPTSNLRVGQLALVKEKDAIPMCWPLCRILKIHPGPDGLVRVVDILTQRGTFRRAVTRIAPLPFSEDVGQPSNGGRDEQD